MTPSRLGALVGVATLVLDQATKLWLLLVVDIAARQPIALGPFVDILLVWNRGISYGLFQQESALGRWLLIVGSLAVAVALAVWLGRSGGRVIALALGLIAGGAVGNAIDRIAYGAVMDFVHIHVGAFSWYVFNVADAAIVAGVAALLYDSVFLERRRANRPRRDGKAGEGA